MTAKISASADGLKAYLGIAAEQALEIDSVAKTVSAVAPYSLNIGTTTGSSANKCVRFADGTQICYYREVRTDVQVTSAYGSLFIGDADVNFAQAFIEPPTVTCSEFSAANQAGWGAVAPGAVSNSTVTLRGTDVTPRALGTTFNISMIAIGRWK